MAKNNGLTKEEQKAADMLARDRETGRQAMNWGDVARQGKTNEGAERYGFARQRNAPAAASVDSLINVVSERATPDSLKAKGLRKSLALPGHRATDAETEFLGKRLRDKKATSPPKKKK